MQFLTQPRVDQPPSSNTRTSPWPSLTTRQVLAEPCIPESHLVQHSTSRCPGLALWFSCSMFRKYRPQSWVRVRVIATVATRKYNPPVPAKPRGRQSHITRHCPYPCPSLACWLSCSRSVSDISVAVLGRYFGPEHRRAKGGHPASACKASSSTAPHHPNILPLYGQVWQIDLAGWSRSWSPPLAWMVDLGTIATNTDKPAGPCKAPTSSTQPRPIVLLYLVWV